MQVFLNLVTNLLSVDGTDMIWQVQISANIFKWWLLSLICLPCILLILRMQFPLRKSKNKIMSLHDWAKNALVSNYFMGRKVFLCKKEKQLSISFQTTITLQKENIKEITSIQPETAL